jgi:DNA-binding NarL/FixJ family response regulator
VADIANEEEHLVRAIAESAEEPDLRTQAIAKRVIRMVVRQVARIREGEQLVTETLAAARSANPDARRRAVVALAWARILRGRAIDDLLQPFAGATTSSLFDISVERPAGVRLAFRGELELARQAFRRLQASADERGEARSGTATQLQLCEIELRAGHPFEAAGLLDEFEGSAGFESERWQWRPRMQALLSAIRGDPERAVQLAALVLEASQSDASLTWDRLEALRATGLAALLERDPERAIASFEPVWEHTVREGVDDPGAFPVGGDLVEALAECGRLAEANTVIAWLEPLAQAQRHPWGLATAKRAAAVVRLVQGYDEGAAEALAGAAADYLALGLGFEHARALLFLGRVQRRFKKRAAARQSLEQARIGFEQLSYAGWAELATSELARVCGRRPGETGDLTASERRVAELVASGLSNKEVAAQLYVSVYTVEAHLSNVYAKLGIRSRTQLARRLHTTP